MTSGHPNKVHIPLADLKEFIKIISREGGLLIYDPVRKKDVSMQPEEMVRQLVVQYLHRLHQVPFSRMAIERALDINGIKRRFDLVVFDTKGKPWLLVECKSFDVKLSENTVLQAAHYNTLLQCPYLLITNGPDAFICQINFKDSKTEFLTELPKI